MTQNVPVTPGSGASIAADLVTDVAGTGTGAADVQFTKIVDGTIGGTNKLLVNADGSLTVGLNTAVAGITQNVFSAISAAGSSVSLPVLTSAFSTFAFTITGTWVATLVFEGSYDGFTYVSIPCAVQSTGALPTSTTANGTWVADVAGLEYFRVRCSLYTSGAATVGGFASSATSLVGLDQPLPTGTNSIGNVTLNAGGNSIGTVVTNGNGAAGATIVGNPVRLGGTARTSNPFAVTDGQTANLMTDKLGRLVVVDSHIRDMINSAAVTLTTTTATTMIGSAGVGKYADITNLQISNSSATATLLTINDGVTSYVYNIGPGAYIGIAFNPPRKQGSAGTNWTATCGTAVSSIYINADYVINL